VPPLRRPDRFRDRDLEFCRKPGGVPDCHYTTPIDCCTVRQYHGPRQFEHGVSGSARTARTPAS
jgi:hypothetical protein